MIKESYYYYYYYYQLTTSPVGGMPSPVSVSVSIGLLGYG